MVVVMSWVVLSADGMASWVASSANGAVSWVALSVDGTVCPVWHCLQVLQAVGRLGPLACGLVCDILCKRCQTGSWRQSAQGSGIGCRLLTAAVSPLSVHSDTALLCMVQCGVGTEGGGKES